MQRVVRLGICVVMVVSLAAAAYGQATTSGTGAINGRVTDGTGAVMPGVTVTVTSPSMMGDRTEVSDADGQYRFTAVPPGDYRVVFELAGFSNVRNEGVRINVGFTATVNAEMKLAEIKAALYGSGSSAAVSDFIVGLGGRDVKARDLAEAVNRALSSLDKGTLSDGYAQWVCEI